MKRHARQRWWVLAGALALAAGVAPLLGPGAPTPVAIKVPASADASRAADDSTSRRVAQLAPDQQSNQQSLAAAFTQALDHLRAGRSEPAIAEFEALTRRVATVPEFQVNLGFALLIAKRLADARQAFERAIELRPSQANAYYGLAVAAEGLGDPRAALGAMRTFVHLAPAQQPHVPRARAAIWEWQASLDAAPGSRRAGSTTTP